LPGSAARRTSEMFSSFGCDLLLFKMLLRLEILLLYHFYAYVSYGQNYVMSKE